MQQKKQFYQSLNFGGFTWSGFWDNLHHFVKRECAGYLEVKCTDEDIKDGNLSDMIILGVTR